MAHRDFVARRGVNKKKGKNKNILIGMMIAVVFAFGIGLYFLKNKTEEKVVKEIIPQTEKTQPKSILPNRPEEVWSYIKALETRTVPVDDKPSSVEKNMRLTEEQRQVLIQMEKDQKAAEEARKLAEQQAAQESTKVDNLSKSTVVQQSSPVKTEQVKKVETVKIDTLSIEAEKKAKQAKLAEIQKEFDKLLDLENKAKENVVATLPDGTVVAVDSNSNTLPKENTEKNVEKSKTASQSAKDVTLDAKEDVVAKDKEQTKAKQQTYSAPAVKSGADEKVTYSRVERAKLLPDTGESSSVAMLVLGAILGAFGLVTVRRKN